jgi:hypothetical protein
LLPQEALLLLADGAFLEGVGDGDIYWRVMRNLETMIPFSWFEESQVMSACSLQGGSGRFHS